MPNLTKRDSDMEEEVLKRIAEGETYASIWRSDKKRFVTLACWLGWCEQDESLSIAYARARDVGFDAIAEETLNIADNTTEDAPSRRVRVETRLKLLAKWAPKRYGDSMQLKHADADGRKIEIGDVEAATRLAAIVAEIRERDAASDDAE